MVQPGKIQVDNLRSVVDLVHLVVVHLMVVQYNHLQVLLSLLLMQLRILQQMDGVIQVEQDIQQVIMEVVVVLVEQDKMQQIVQQVMGDLVCNFPQHLETLFQV